ncbi:Rad17 cell cycle checkpoint protein-domain-containing protein [Aspergillus aurantiobrunneus]
MDDNEDLIEDDYDSYDELFTEHFTEEKLSQFDGTEAVPAPQDRPPSSSATKGAKGQPKSVNNAKRFLLQSKPSSKIASPTPLQPQKENLPWVQRYAPLTLEELAVHKRKVQNVEQWLNDALTGKARQNLLVLKGPAGSGKTTTISLLSDKLKFNILEWKPPSTFEYATKDYVSLGTQFDGFLSRGHKFGSLDLDGSDGSQISIEGSTNNFQRRIILIEEFPTISSRTTPALAAFRLSVLRYISMNASLVQTDYDGESGIPPIVMIVSETFSNPESSFDNYTIQRLLGREICNHSSTAIIEFNSIAPTFMFKALGLILEKGARQPWGNQARTQSILGKLSKIGDIRNAVTSLEFLCLASGNQKFWGTNNHTVRTWHATRTGKTIPSVSSEAPEILTQREFSLGLFHAVGKIIYNKRNSGAGTEILQHPPPSEYLRDVGRPGDSQVPVNELLDEIGTDIQSFIGTLHENYVLSCSGPLFTECLDGCIGSLSDSDVLCVGRKDHSRPQTGLGTGFVKTGAGVELLRQEEISYQVAARGLLFALPYPVKRQMSFTDNVKRNNDSHKLFFPPTIRLVRDFEKTQGLIDLWGDALLEAAIRPAAVPLPDQGQHTPRQTTDEDGENQSFDEDSVPIVAMISRNDLILHQLAYMTMILGECAESSSLQKITGIGVRSLDYNSQKDEEYAWDPSLQGNSASHLQKRIAWLGPQAPLVSQANDEQLILSDDDIVDDP